MKNKIILSIGLLSLITTSCVQKTFKKTVVFTIDVSKVKDIKTVGIRGEKPLDWNYDTELSVIKKNSIYSITKTFETGYKFVEVKFTVNGNYELANQPNRKVIFNSDGVTKYNTIFNVMK